MATVGWVIVALVIIVCVAGIALLLWGLKRAFKLVINSLIGFFALWLTQVIFLPNLLINFWSVILTAILGIIGYAIVIILHLLNVAF